jgi:predicted phage terminase large subunit-like protein
LERARLLDGDWNVFERGELFERHWFEIVDQVPSSLRVRRCRFWDMASTEKDGDWTVGALLAESNGQVWVESIVRGQWAGATLEKVLMQTAQIDGRSVAIRMEQEGGSSGKNLISNYQRGIFAGYDFDGIRPTGDKVTRAKPWAVAAENGNVKIVANEWNKRLLDEAELFPLGAHDDQVDAISGAFEHLMFGRRARLLV